MPTMGELARDDEYTVLDPQAYEPPPTRVVVRPLAEGVYGPPQEYQPERYTVSPPGYVPSFGERDEYGQQAGQPMIEAGAEMGGLAMGGGMPLAAKGAVGMAGGKLTVDAAKELKKAKTAERIAGFSSDKGLAAPYTTYKKDALRAMYPGVYQSPKEIARQGAANVAPEHPALKQLFGVTRDDLWEIGQRGKRQGNMEPWIPGPANPGGSYVSDALMNPRNAQRLIDTLAEAEKYPQLTRGMDAWYVMDPMYQQMVKLVGPERAKAEYFKFNMIVPPFSAGSNVMTEINRGTAANMMATRGEFPTFMRYGGVAEDKRGSRFPAELKDVIGHAYHGVQARPVERYLATGYPEMQSVKVPLYMQASGVPQIGFQTRLPVPDAHFARASGAADVRMNAKPGEYMKGPEYYEFGPWYRENVAKPLGIEAVPAQGRQWGVYAPQTGVDTPVGAPKLELISQAIWERAAKLGIDPRVLRDQVLLGKEHAVWPLVAAPAAGVMGEAARQDQY